MADEDTPASPAGSPDREGASGELEDMGVLYPTNDIWDPEAKLMSWASSP